MNYDFLVSAFLFVLGAVCLFGMYKGVAAPTTIVGRVKATLFFGIIATAGLVGIYFALVGR